MNMRLTADDYINQLDLQEHAEGGYYKELYKSSHTARSAGQSNERALSSTIYYLLKSGQVSRFHKLLSDEIWFFHAGSPLRIYMIDSQGALTVTKLGLAIDEGEKPQAVVPANTIFGADVVEADSFTLVSCMVSPGFEYDDFYLYSRDELIEIYPEHNVTIARLNSIK